MKQFRFWRDPLFLTACALYAINRWLVKPCCDSAFLHCYFNDLLLIPAALPPVLWLQRKLGLRTNGASPAACEIAFHLVTWSLFCEVIGPRFMPGTVADPLDILAYAVGGVFAWLWWNRPVQVQTAVA